MNSLAAYAVINGAVLGLFVGVVHIGFALTDDTPRNIWSWYVVATGIGMFAMSIPALKHLAAKALS